MKALENRLQEVKTKRGCQILTKGSKDHFYFAMKKTKVEIVIICNVIQNITNITKKNNLKFSRSKNAIINY